MRRAETLAKKALGDTTPNPIVGAVLVKDGQIIGEGYHSRAGQPHAEIEALRSITDRTKLAGSTIYVTLEPCSTWGRTPPCTDAIIESGIRRVVIGCSDPNPKHKGAAIRILRDHGIEVLPDVDRVRCFALNEDFFKWITTGKPFVLLKMASTLDGKIATANGSSQWITGPVARKRVQELRRWADAVAVGAGTFKTDRPRLTVRNKNGQDLKVPKRFVVSHETDLILPEGWTRVALSDQKDWDDFLLSLGKKQLTSILLEGGGELAASALKAGAVDKIEFHYAPKILCGKSGRPIVGGEDPESLSEALNVRDLEIRKLGNDFSVTGYIKGPSCLLD